MATPLFRRHSPGLAATYADLENQALSSETVLLGTPGSVSLRTNASGVRFWTRQHYDFERRKRDQYLVAYDAPEAEARLRATRQQIGEAQAAIGSVRLLAREGYLTMTPRHFAVLAALGNRGLFRAGAVLVGAHAYEVIVNRLGIRAPSFPTEDLDIARATRLSLAAVPENGLLGILNESGVDFAEIRPLDPRQPTTKFKERGRARFTVDLLVPADGTDPGFALVPELQAHATALPYFRFLLGETQWGAALSSHGVAGVRVPTPERFALHKLIVSRLRPAGSEKSQKDLRQAAILVAAVGELFPGALAAAYGRTAVSTRTLIRKSLEMVREPLQAHPQAWEEISSRAKV